MKRLITVAALSLGLVFGFNAAVMGTASALGFDYDDAQVYLQETQEGEGATLFLKKVEAEVKAAPQEYRVLAPENGAQGEESLLNAVEHVGAAGI